TQGMKEYNRLAAIEFRVKLVLFRLAKVAVADMCEQADAFELERIERVFGLTDRGSDVGQRQDCKRAETIRMVRDHSGGVFVALARQAAGEIRVAEINAG